jgi:hypothetical protein
MWRIFTLTIIDNKTLMNYIYARHGDEKAPRQKIPR